MAEEDTEPPPDLKIILLGDSAVGKSKMVERFLMDNYNPRQLSTYALTLFRHNATVDGRDWRIDFWDTAGQEQFEELHPSYFYQANAAVMAFDVTRKVTYKNLEKWLSQMKRHCHEKIPVVCVANKVDVEPSARQRSFKFPQENQMPFYHVSASTGENVVRVFNEVISLAIKNKEEPEDEVMAEIMRLLKDDDNAGDLMTAASSEAGV